MTEERGDRLDRYAERIEPELEALQLRCLDAQREKSFLDQAAGLEILPEDAERCLLLLCRQKGIGVERFLERDFLLQVKAVLGDRFLDESERQVLLEQGRELFALAPDPGGAAQGILEREVEASQAYSELKLRRDLAERLAGRRKLARREWEAIRDQVAQKAEKAGVNSDENELGALSDQFLVASTVKIQDGAAPVVMVLWTALVAVLTYLGCWYFLS